LTVPVGGSIVRLRTQNVPAGAPAGYYWYEGRVGDYPSAIWDTSGFGFTKSGAGISDSGMENWTNTGEDFSIEMSAHSRAAMSGSGATPTMEVSPNPFNPRTVLSYQLPVAGSVSLRVYDMAGRLVGTLVDGWRSAGTHELTFDASDLPSGMYFARLEAGEYVAVQKLILL